MFYFIGYIIGLSIGAWLIYLAIPRPTISGEVLAKLGPGWSCELRIFGSAYRPGLVLDVQSITYQFRMELDDGTEVTVDVSEKDFDSVVFARYWANPREDYVYPRWTGRPSKIHKHWSVKLWRAK